MSSNKKMMSGMKDDKIMMMYKEKSDKMDHYSKRLEEKIQKLTDKIEQQNMTISEKNKSIQKYQMEAENVNKNNS